MLRSLTLAGGLLLGLSLPMPVEAAGMTDETTQTIRWTYLRAGPGINHRVLRAAFPGASVTVHNCTRRWCNVTYGGSRGWMWAAYLDRQM